MMAYPVELTVGQNKLSNSDYKTFFKERNWQHTWDFDKHTGDYWHNVLYNKKIIMQIDMEVPLVNFIKDLKEQMPNFDPDKKDDSILMEIRDMLKEQKTACIYFSI